jgi:hypothetical protein
MRIDPFRDGNNGGRPFHGAAMWPGNCAGGLARDSLVPVAAARPTRGRRKKRESVTHVSGTKWHPCLGARDTWNYPQITSTYAPLLIDKT